ncbi:MAG: hypothetical protein JRG74_09095 [Deltaproteobacteria bacterium]|nr:hypothetical protein [Deltaproteobacteria bacterium]
MSVESIIIEMAKAARAASVEMARCPSDKKNEALIRRKIKRIFYAPGKWGFPMQ